MKPEKKRLITALVNTIKIFCFLSGILCWQLYLLQQHMLEKCSEIGLCYSDLQTGWLESGLQRDSLINQWWNLALNSFLRCETSAIFVGVENGLALWCWCVWSWDGWMEQCIWDEFWRDGCHIGWEGVSHGEVQLLITRSVQVIEQRSIFLVFSVWKWTSSLWTCQQTQVHVRVLWPALGAALRQLLVSQGVQAVASCLLRSGCICPHSQFTIHMGVHRMLCGWWRSLPSLPGASILRALIPGRVTCCHWQAEGMSHLCQQRRSLS